MRLETERLMIRAIEDGDFQDLTEMLQDPDVVRAYEHEFTDDDVQAWLDRQKQRMSRFGFSLWP